MMNAILPYEFLTPESLSISASHFSKVLTAFGCPL
jgi:hypothetical protein